MSEGTAKYAKYAKSLTGRVFLFLRISRISRLLSLFRRRELPFQKYKVAPRLGARAVQRRLLMRLRGCDTPFFDEFESATEI